MSAAPVVVVVEGGAPTPDEFATALGLEYASAVFNGALQYQRHEEPGDPATWRTVGAIGRYGVISALADIRFMLSDPRVTKVRVLKLADEV